jgi:hypothetical protein
LQVVDFPRIDLQILPPKANFATEPFDELCARCVPQGDAEVFTWTMTTPVADTGRILRVVGRGAAARRAGRHAGAAWDCTRS